MHTRSMREFFDAWMDIIAKFRIFSCCWWLAKLRPEAAE